MTSNTLTNVDPDVLLMLVADDGLDAVAARYGVDRPTLLRQVRRAQKVVAHRDAEARAEIAMEHVRDVAAGKLSDSAEHPVLPNIKAAINAAKKQLEKDPRALAASVTSDTAGKVAVRQDPIQRIREVLTGERPDDPECPVMPHVMAALSNSNQQLLDVVDDLIASGALDRRPGDV